MGDALHQPSIALQAIQLSPCYAGLAGRDPTTPSGISRFNDMLRFRLPFGIG